MLRPFTALDFHCRQELRFLKEDRPPDVAAFWWLQLVPAQSAGPTH